MVLLWRSPTQRLLTPVASLPQAPAGLSPSVVAAIPDSAPLPLELVRQLPAVPPCPSAPSAPQPLDPTRHPRVAPLQRLSLWRFELARQRGGKQVDFAGLPTLEERSRLLDGCHGPAKCGFMAASGYDELAVEAARLSAHCSVVVLTAIFGSKDKLQQPEDVPAPLANCYFAFVDEESAAFLAATASPSLKRKPSTLSARRVGVWRLLTLRHSPYASARRASRVPKMLPFQLFPRANFSLWMDGKLKLLVPPMDVVSRLLLAPGAAISLPRNLRRDHIDEEMRWIRSTLAKEPAKLRAPDARKVEAQWAFYVDEQRQRAAGSDGSSAGVTGNRAVPDIGGAQDAGAAALNHVHDATAATDAWVNHSACVEGAMMIVDLRSALARCVLCAWFNEWHRFGERDQLAFSYVLLAMGLTPPTPPPDEFSSNERAIAGTLAPLGARRHQHDHGVAAQHRGVYLWPRREHWHFKQPRSQSGQPKAKRWRSVKYVGHGGCAGDSSAALVTGCQRTARLNVM